jgi:hypothetical protein
VYIAFDSCQLRRNNQKICNAESDDKGDDELALLATLNRCKKQRAAQLTKDKLEKQFASRGRRDGPPSASVMHDGSWPVAPSTRILF